MKHSVKELENFAREVRINIVEMLLNRGYGHVGGSLSIVEVLTVLYLEHMNINLDNIDSKDRDMFVLSKGHAGPGLYATLANLGFFEKEILNTLNDGGTILPSHPDRLKTKGVDMTTGSLGQGISVAAGIAKGFKLNNSNNYVYSIVGDGELNEGQTWEAFQFIAHNALNNAIVIIDDNKKQLDGKTCDVLNQFDIKSKMESFGFYTIVVKGNDIEAIYNTIEALKKIEDSAVCLILDSIKGQGIPFFEEYENNHSIKFDNEEIISKTKEEIAILKDGFKE